MYLFIGYNVYNRSYVRLEVTIKWLIFIFYSYTETFPNRIS